MNKFTKKIFDPNFSKGMGDLYDNTSLRESVFNIIEEDDGRAMRKDWEKVGGDIYHAIHEYERSYPRAAGA